MHVLYTMRIALEGVAMQQPQAGGWLSDIIDGGVGDGGVGDGGVGDGGEASVIRRATAALATKQAT